MNPWPTPQNSVFVSSSSANAVSAYHAAGPVGKEMSNCIQKFDTSNRNEVKNDEFGESLQSYSQQRSESIDRRDMARLGRSQHLPRNFRVLSLVSFTVIAQVTWEYTIVSMEQGLSDGGFAGLIWSYLWTFLGFFFVVASLAEMSSMAPTSGGQYHWVSEFAPRKCQRLLSYITGWLSTLGWLSGTATGPFLAGTMIQSLLYVNDNNYQSTKWHGIGFVLFNVLVLYLACVPGRRFIPVAQNAFLLLHIMAFFAVAMPLWVMAEHQPIKVALTQFSNFGGYKSMGVSIMVGQLSGVWSLIGSDAAAHMAEEVKDASRSVPVAMIGSFLLNGVLGLIMTITIVVANPSLENSLNDPTGYPFLYVFKAAMPLPYLNTLTALLIVLIMASAINYNTSTARELYAFARDNGVPFSDWISRIHPTLQIPVNAVCLSCAFCVLVSLIDLGSTSAYNAIASLYSVAVMATYAISIGCILWRRIFLPASLPPTRWSLGRWAIPVNVCGLAYSVSLFFWGFWPSQASPISIENFNLAVLVFFVVTIVAVIVFLVRGAKVYRGPVALVKGRELEE